MLEEGVSWCLPHGYSLSFFFLTLALINSKHVLCCHSVVSTLYNPMQPQDSLQPHSPLGSSVHGDSPDKNTGVGCHALLQGFSQPRDQTQASLTAGVFFTV